LIYYLNDGWDAASDGGAFRAYVPKPLARRLGLPAGAVPVIDVAPVSDTLIVFRADKLLHEVRPTSGRHDRLAATLWLSARSRGGAGLPSAAPRPLLYPRKEYGRAVDAALRESPFRPMHQSV
jgi:Rps23 Pro-64 3,4-dihydroxylase Tpa1-like proline 4-hydroxylase